MTSLVVFDQAREALERIETIDDAKKGLDALAALQAYAQAVKVTEQQANEIAALSLRYKHKAGTLLSEELPSAGPGRGHKGSRLAELGISKNASSQWQRIAKIPSEKLETYLANATAAGKTITQKDALQIARHYAGEQTRQTPQAPNMETGAYADSAENEVIQAQDADSAGYVVNLITKARETALTKCSPESVRVWRLHTGFRADGTEGEPWSIQAIATQDGKTKEATRTKFIEADRRVAWAIAESLTEYVLSTVEE